MRRYFLRLLILSGLFLVQGTVSVEAREESRRPNILFIMSDDHAAQVVGAYESWLKDYVRTPTLDRLAAEGMRFTNVCCNNSICSPSRASIITGQYSHVNGGLNLGCMLPPESPSYIIELKKAGYATAVIGKWHMGHWPRGCDDYAVTKGQGKYFNPGFNHPDGSQTKHQGYYADVYTDRALDWLKSGRDKEKPFYLSLHFKGPHAPFDYPERWAHLHEGVEIPEPPNLHEDVRARSPRLKALNYSMLESGGFAQKDYTRTMMRNEVDGTYSEGKLPEDLERNTRKRRSAAYQHMIHKFIRCVAAIDDNIGRVMEYLEGEGLADDTLVIYTSDQGYWLGQHGLFDKRLILEESLKMPFIVRYPKEIEAGKVSHKLGMNIDFGPTMLDFAGVAKPSAMQGVSLRPLLRGEEPEDWRKGIFYAYYARAPYHWGIRTERHKLVRFPGTDEIEFYDLGNDPLEMTDQSENPEFEERIAAVEAQLKALMAEVGIAPQFLMENMKVKDRAGKKKEKKGGAK